MAQPTTRRLVTEKALADTFGGATPTAFVGVVAATATRPRLTGTRGLAICGDSNSATGVTGAGGTGVYNFLSAPRIPTENTSWIGWATLNSGGRYHVAHHAATPGITPTTWNAQFLASVLAARPFAAVDALGTNNVENLSQQIAALTAMYDAFDAAQIKVIVCTIPPKQGAQDHVQRLNRWKRHTARNRGYLLVDNYTAVVDPATGAMAASLDGGDGIHWNAAGARAVGNAFGATIQAEWPVLAEIATATGQTASLVAKPLMLSIVSFAPDGWTHLGGISSADAVESVADVPGVVGKMFKVAQTGAGAVQCNMAHTLPDLVPGRRYALTYKTMLTAVGSTTLSVRLELATGGGENLASHTISQTQALTTVSYEFTVPPGLTGYNYRLRWQFVGATGAEAGIGQVTLVDLTASGLS